MEKKPFVTKEQLDEITKTYPTPFHLYDEKGIRENMKNLKEAFSWNPGFREYFAVKATPNPFLINILKEYGCGCDCSSYTELMLSEAIGVTGDGIMFSSNDTPAQDFELADRLGAIINLDDITHIDFLEKTIGHIPETISCRYNPGGLFKISNDIMDNPGDAKYGMTTEQITEAYKILKEKGAKEFGLHAFLASNTVTNDYYPMLAKVLFEQANFFVILFDSAFHHFFYHSGWLRFRIVLRLHCENFSFGSDFGRVYVFDGHDFRFGSGDLHRYVVNKFEERVRTSHKVGFAAQVNHGIIFAVRLNGNAAFFGFAVGPFGHIGQSFFAQKYDGLFHIVFAFQQGFFAVHQARTGFFSKDFDVFG